MLADHDASPRQRESLAHDRELADLDDLRKLLDRAAVALDQARTARREAQMGRDTLHGIVIASGPIVMRA
jgi:hypothetical protein